MALRGEGSMTAGTKEGAVQTTPAAGTTHRLARLDGIRALAVCLVFAAHTFWRGRGWQGVHLFFVLSGFLITGVLRRAQKDEGYWRSFYIKRATRILPPLAIFFIVGIWLYSPPWKVVPAYVFFGANIIAVTRYGFKNAFDVLWSLSVEEHFYLLWPIAVRFCSRAQLIRLSLAICVAEPLLRLAFTRVFQEANPIYMLTPFQIDGLAAGSLLALLCESEAMRARIARWCGRVFWMASAIYVALALASNSFVFSSRSFLFNGAGYSLVVLSAVALLASVYLHPRSLASRVLGSRVLVFLGAISYGFYLYHPLLLDLFERLLGQRYDLWWGKWATIVAGFVASVGMSWVSFHFYEKRAILWGRRLADAGASKSARLPAV